MWTRLVIATGKVCRLNLWCISKTKISGLVISENSNSHCPRQLKKPLSLSMAVEWKSEVYFFSEIPTRSLNALRVVSKLEKICKECPPGDTVWFYLKICDLWHTFHILAAEWKETHMETIVTFISKSHWLQKTGPPQVLYWFSWVKGRLIYLFVGFFSYVPIRPFIWKQLFRSQLATVSSAEPWRWAISWYSKHSQRAIHNINQRDFPNRRSFPDGNSYSHIKHLYTKKAGEEWALKCSNLTGIVQAVWW